VEPARRKLHAPTVSPDGQPAQPDVAARIHPDTRVGAVRLRVADVDRVAGFYERAIGLRAIERTAELARLGAGGDALVELVAAPGAPPRPPGTTGLFHLAILVPSRAELARALRRVAEAGERLGGASDHLVSEALYLSDPEGNGIEIYRDRAREEWRRSNGDIEMATLPLDVESLIGELRGDGEPRPAPPDTRIGHVHLNVSDLADAEAFYVGALGFDVTVRGYPGALFVSAGGYHHHIGLNTWAGEGAPPSPPGSRGLVRFELVLPDAEALDGAARRLESAGVPAERRNGGLELADPSGNGLLLRTTGATLDR
jgi:catechol 2,3-dioxygenase